MESWFGPSVLEEPYSLLDDVLQTQNHPQLRLQGLPVGPALCQVPDGLRTEPEPEDQNLLKNLPGPTGGAPGLTSRAEWTT